MEFCKEIMIDLPREEVIKKLRDPENFRYWQRGFISYKKLTGQFGQEGSIGKLKIKTGKGHLDLLETVLKNKLPKEFRVAYDTAGLYHIQKHYFEAESPSSTHWIIYNELKFSGNLKIMAPLVQMRVKNEIQQSMKNFKAFAEEGKSINEK